MLTLSCAVPLQLRAAASQLSLYVTDSSTVSTNLMRKTVNILVSGVDDIESNPRLLLLLMLITEYNFDPKCCLDMITIDKRFCRSQLCGYYYFE